MKLNALNNPLRDLSNLLPQIAGALVTVIVLIATIVGLVQGEGEGNTGNSSDRVAGIVQGKAENLSPENLKQTTYMVATKNTKSGGKNYPNSVETTRGKSGFIRIKESATVKRLVLHAGYPDGTGKGKRGTVTVQGGNINRTYDVRPGETTLIDIRFDGAGLITVGASTDVALLSPVIYR